MDNKKHENSSHQGGEANKKRWGDKNSHHDDRPPWAHKLGNPVPVFRFDGAPMTHEVMVVDKDGDGVPYLETVHNMDGFSYHVDIDLVGVGTGERVHWA